jgi:hypothetical protein
MFPRAHVNVRLKEPEEFESEREKHQKWKERRKEKAERLRKLQDDADRLKDVLKQAGKTKTVGYLQISLINQFCCFRGQAWRG